MKSQAQKNTKALLNALAPTSESELREDRTKELDWLENFMNINKNKISATKISAAFEVINTAKENMDLNGCYDKKWFAAQLRNRGIYKLDNND